MTTYPTTIFDYIQARVHGVHRAKLNGVDIRECGGLCVARPVFLGQPHEQQAWTVGENIDAQLGELRAAIFGREDIKVISNTDVTIVRWKAGVV